MPSRSGASAPSAADSAQRVEVFLALPAVGGGLVTVPADTCGPERLPGAVLAHGEHPRDAAVRACAAVLGGQLPALPDRDSLRLLGVLSDVCPLPADLRPRSSGLRPGLSGLHVLRLLLEPGRGPVPPVDDALLTTPVPAPAAEDVPGVHPRVQRPAAYVLVVHDGQVLLTRVTGSELWTLPGGGIDHGEHPDDAVRRETLEETGLELMNLRLVDVDSSRFTGRSPRAVTEDFHGVRLLYQGTVSSQQTPAVQEVDGTTEAAAWWPLAALDQLWLGAVVRVAIDRLA
jgi:8-oxo-dGTP diphosphatase